MNEWCIEAMAEIPSISFLPQVRDDFKEKTKTLSSFKNLFFRDFVIVVQSLSCVRLFSTLYTTAYQASLSFTISWSLLKLISFESVMPSNHHPSFGQKQHAWTMAVKQLDEWEESLKIGLWILGKWNCTEQLCMKLR